MNHQQKHATVVQHCNTATSIGCRSVAQLLVQLTQTLLGCSFRTLVVDSTTLKHQRKPPTLVQNCNLLGHLPQCCTATGAPNADIDFPMFSIQTIFVAGATWKRQQKPAPPVQHCNSIDIMRLYPIDPLLTASIEKDRPIRLAFLLLTPSYSAWIS